MKVFEFNQSDGFGGFFFLTRRRAPSVAVNHFIPASSNKDGGIQAAVLSRQIESASLCRA